MGNTDPFTSQCFPPLFPPHNLATCTQTKPLRIAIRGGRDTPIGGQIIISQILDGGAAADYGSGEVH